MDPDEVFGDEWRLGEDGLLFRKGARILMFDDQGRLLLIRGHDWGQEDRSWWFTVGGGLGWDEDPREGVIREALEETGIALSHGQVQGPIAHRSAVFDFVLRTVRQQELFYVAYGVQGELAPAALSSLETHLLDEYRWWDLTELGAAQAAGETLYPLDLVPFAQQLAAGWDGTIRELSGE